MLNLASTSNCYIFRITFRWLWFNLQYHSGQSRWCHFKNNIYYHSLTLQLLLFRALSPFLLTMQSKCKKNNKTLHLPLLLFRLDTRASCQIEGTQQERALESIEPGGRDTPSRLQTIAATKAHSAVTSCPQPLDQEVVLALNTPFRIQPAAFCNCMRGISCHYQQLSIVYIHNLNGETETRIYELRRYTKRKQSSA